MSTNIRARHQSQSLLILASVFLVCSCAPQSRPHVEVARAASRDQASLIAAAQHFLRVFDDLDWEQFRAAWSRNPTAFSFSADKPERIEGAAVFASFRQFFAEVRARRKGPPYLNIVPRGLRAETFGSAGVVTFMLGNRPGDIGRRTLLFVIENGEWKLAHLHASIIEPTRP